MTVTDERKAKILDKAAEVIEERGWTQGRVVDNATGAVCLLGALRVAGGLAPDGLSGLACEVPGLTEAYNTLFEWLSRSNELHVVSDWQDAEGRTAEQVISELRACAAELRGGAA